jgi:hypothetical protein
MEQASRTSDIVEIAKRNGDFRRNYGILVGAFLYLRSLHAAARQPKSWVGLAIALLTAALAVWAKFG